MVKATKLIISNWQNTVPNFITLGRLFICLWALNVFYWWDWNPWYMLLLCALGVCLDGLDGFVARNYGQISFAGKLLDPLVDKIISWNAVLTIGLWTAFRGDIASWMLTVPCIVPLIPIGIYDHMTMKMRGTDETMVTNPIAKLKQATLFTALGLLLMGICFDDAYSKQHQQALYATHVLLNLFGTLLLFQTLRMTASSARLYFEKTSDPTARSWARVAWVQLLTAIP